MSRSIRLLAFATTANQILMIPAARPANPSRIGGRAILSTSTRANNETSSFQLSITSVPPFLPILLLKTKMKRFFSLLPLAEIFICAGCGRLSVLNRFDPAFGLCNGCEFKIQKSCRSTGKAQPDQRQGESFNLHQGKQ